MHPGNTKPTTDCCRVSSFSNDTGSFVKFLENNTITQGVFMDAAEYGLSVLALTIMGIVAFLFLGGCARNAPYHTDPGGPGNCRGAQTGQGCTEAYYQEHDTYDLAFVEFSDRGNAFNDRFVSDVLDRIREKVSENGAVIITFVHGWKHDANEADDNVKQFKETLKALGTELKKEFGNDSALGKRQLVGVYVGWRGKSLKARGLEEATFWDRKAAAGEVGKGGITHLLLDLNQILEDNEVEGLPDPNVLVVVGHSLGGAIVVSALNELLTERVVKRDREHDWARTLLDGVIVINPAIEATQVLPFVEAAIKVEDYRPRQRPLFVSLSSDADWATHFAFPAGQVAGLLTWRKTELERSYLRDRGQPEQPLPLREEHLDNTTIGNFAPFLTHRLTKRKQDGQVYFDFQTCSADPNGCEPKGWTTLSGRPFIKLPPNYPLYFIKTDATVMRGHNDIFNPGLRAFLVTVIDDVVRGKLAPTMTAGAQEPVSMPSILTQPDELVQRVQERYTMISQDPQR
jgi:pimeloyl-ACP methyl ester carboxylesterase